MTPGRVASKAESYRLLAVGAFGNVIPQYFDLDEWEASEDCARYDLWGVRTLTPGGPCRLLCPRAEVRATAEAFAPHAVNVSVMVGPVFGVSLMADVHVGEQGLVVYGVERPPDDHDWRRDMPSKGRQFGRLESALALRRHLTPSSHSDLMALLDAYPDHVVELSALRRCYGSLPGRNAVIWEVRCADGSYERPFWKNPAFPPLTRPADGG